VRRERRATLGSVFREATRLPERECLELLERLSEYLTAQPQAPLAQLPKCLVRRRAALAALGIAAAELQREEKLDLGQAPTAAQYTTVAGKLKLPSSASIARAFGLWRHAVSAFLGESAPESSERRRIREKVSRRRSSHTEPLAGLRIWLESGPSDTSPRAYTAFAEAHNRGLGSAGVPLVGYTGVVSALCLSWSTILRVARGDLAFSQARAEEIKKIPEKAGPLGLIGTAEIALLLDRTRPQIHHLEREGKLPPCAATIGKRKAWRLADIKALRDGKPVPATRSEKLTFLTVEEVAKLVGYQARSLRTAIQQERFSKVPKPDGRIGWSYYWQPESIELFQEAERRKGRTPTLRFERPSS
jgi:hypothetical protein